SETVMTGPSANVLARKIPYPPMTATTRTIIAILINHFTFFRSVMALGIIENRDKEKIKKL
ncbi:MAG TPA: hypothetical protein VJH25_01225, partial [Candidatus Paceibacterota bacterium]